MINRRAQNSQGFTLIEILIAVAVGMLVMGAVFALFNSQQQQAISNEVKGEFNSNINSTSGILINQVRMAGFGIPKEAALNPVNNFGITGGTQAAQFDGAGTGPTNSPADLLVAQIKPGTDGLLVLHADNTCTTLSDQQPVDVNDPFDDNATGTAIFCKPNCFDTGSSPYTVNDVGLVFDRLGTGGSPRGIFVKITAVSTQTSGSICGGASFTRVSYAGMDELNLSIKKNGAPTTDQRFYRLETAYYYYVNVQNQLMRLPVNTVFAPETVSDGVEDFQVQFDLDTSPACDITYWLNNGVVCPNSTVVATRCAACNMPATIPAGTMPYLNEIRGVKLGFVVRAPKEDKVHFLNKGATYALFDHTPAAAVDSFRRLTVQQLVRVKNLELQDL